MAADRGRNRPAITRAFRPRTGLPQNLPMTTGYATDPLPVPNRAPVPPKVDPRQSRDSLALPGRGVAYAYDVYGPEDGVPMVLIHELGGTGRRWVDVAPAFATSHRVYAPDIRGHGHSGWAAAYSHRLIADDLIVLMDLLGLRGAVLVGHSAGGNIGYLVAMARPDLVSRLVIEDVMPPYPRDRETPTKPKFPIPHDWRCIATLMDEVKVLDEWMWAQLAHLPMPVLILVGRGKSHIQPELLEESARLIPDADLAYFDVGHFIHRAVPSEFTSTILTWLADRAGVSRGVA